MWTLQEHGGDRGNVSGFCGTQRLAMAQAISTIMSEESGRKSCQSSGKAAVVGRGSSTGVVNLQEHGHH